MSHPKVILLSLEANARKSLSQNFLTSPHWATLLTDEALAPAGVEEIWEIGPGLGALTSELLRKTQLPVRAFEYDRKLSAYLRETYGALDLHEGDVMDADFAAVSPGKRVSVLSNLPYHLSSPLLFKLLDVRTRVARSVLTFQKEFAQRLIAPPRSPDYGSLSVAIQLHYSIRNLGIIPPGAFYPAPSVSSQALALEPWPEAQQPPAYVREMVRAGFKQRRKKLSSNLREAYPGAEIVPAMEAMKISPNARPEELSKEQFLELALRLRPAE